MPRYWPLRRISDDRARNWTIDRLLALREQLSVDVAAKTDHSLLLATWNIRDFDSNKFGHGKRLSESLHYIAEIISAFELVAVQEVNRDMSGLNRVMELLGRNWQYIITDTTEGFGGNQERLAFLYDTRKVWFRNVAGEIVLPKGQKIVSRRKIKDDQDPDLRTVEEDEVQFARTPFMVAFQAGWFKFNLCTVHIYYGSASGQKLRQRIAEIQGIAKFFAKRQKKETEDYILLGDFNIVSPEHETMKALEDQGFVVPQNLRREETNLRGDKHYDQIALKVKEKRLEIGVSGVFDYRKSVFRDRDYEAYASKMPADKRDFDGDGRATTDAQKRAYYRNLWRTWQMSDHLPMWVELKTDFTEDYLKSLKSGRRPLSG